MQPFHHSKTSVTLSPTDMLGSAYIGQCRLTGCLAAASQNSLSFNALSFDVGSNLSNFHETEKS